MPSKKKSPPSQSTLFRTAKLFGMAASVASQEITTRIGEKFGKSDPVKKLKKQMNQAHELVSALSELKGAAMKAGQWLGIEAADLLPPEVVSVLRQLHDQGSSLPIEQVQKIINRELGLDKAGQLQELSVEPIGSASIGQVHRAKLNGQDVAVKVQFPGIAKAIESDLKVLRRISESFLALSQRKVSLKAVFAEMRDTLLQEANYELEASLLTEYGQLAKTNSAWRVPTVYSDFCSPRVLTMSYESGTRLSDWLASNPSPQDLAYYSEKFLDLYFTEFFEWGVVQTDPNFANFLIRTDTRQIVLLDFGAIRRYSEDFRRLYFQVMICIHDQQFDKAYEKGIELGWIDRRESKEAKALFIEMLSQSSRPFDFKQMPFDFTDERFLNETRASTIKLVKQLKYTAPPHSLIFLHRKLGGIYFILKSMKAKIDLRPYIEKIRARYS